MYDRALRESFKPIGSTAETVGPGAYELEFTTRSRIKSDGYAPFQSMTSRETYLHINDTTIAAPGPGHYDPSLAHGNVKGGKTMQNKSKRFSELGTWVPGPGAYSVQKEKEWLKNTGKSFKHFGEKEGGQTHAKGALVTSRIKFNRMPEAPSIPTPGQAYGFEENDDGTLRKQEPPGKDSSLGPAFYQVDNTWQPKPTRVYKGNKFGNRTSKRIDFVRARDGPGPGEYEPYISPEEKAENANVKEETQKRFEAKIPRYHELIEKVEEKKSVPGPGKYEIQGEFDPKPPKVNVEGIEIEHPPFGSQQKRFTGQKQFTPSPGAYNDPRTALDGLKRVTGLKRSPFGQTAVRFQPAHNVRKTPGPGSYNHLGMGGDSMRKAYIESTRRGVFGTTSVRVQPLAEKEKAEVPGPGQYQIKEKMFVPKYQQLSANFSSLTGRLVEQDPTAKEVPPPGSYNVDQSYKHSQVKLAIAPPRNKDAARRHNAFQISASRFAKPGDIKIKAPDPVVPGPGTYDPKVESIEPHGGLMTTKDKRFRMQKIDQTPGPGAYEFSPLIQDTVLKGTFNASLNNPVTPQIEPMRGGTAQAKHAFLLGV